ncbi:hypothetical protein V9T40_012390 [Parthenolecanium corni]|uniref:Uncharacterized protein n=1 Tax=Parthenolecanium corni TaxID=536013 RepID=A0AAN9TAM2_9HEMI
MDNIYERYRQWMLEQVALIDAGYAIPIYAPEYVLHVRLEMFSPPPEHVQPQAEQLFHPAPPAPPVRDVNVPVPGVQAFVMPPSPSPQLVVVDEEAEVIVISDDDEDVNVVDEDVNVVDEDDECEAIKKFIKCNEDAEQIGYDWISGIDFETFQDSDPSDKSDSKSGSEYEYESE